MTEAKLEFTVGTLTFSGEGEQIWLAEQLDKVIAAAPDLASVGRTRDRSGAADTTELDEPAGDFTKTLAGYLKEKKAETNQVQRFLATADWLRRRGTGELTTSAVTKALSDNQQKRLGNPADSLNKNVAKGYCEKKGTGFFITPDGLTHLGSP
jgi:hypothetical protein